MNAGAAPPGGLRLRTAQGRWVIAVAVAGSGMAALDGTIVGIALPVIGRDLHSALTGLQWVVTGYMLTLAGLLLLGGALGDRYGRRKVFLIGVVWFAIASGLCGLAPNVDVLIFARALQGIGGALLTPGSLAILQASFAKDDRAGAIGAWSGLGGVATAIGPFLGGWLIDAVSWRLIFYINLPVAAGLVLAARHVPESSDPAAPRRVDVRGATLITAGLVGITYGLIEGPSSGWSDPAVLVALVAGAVASAGFVVAERIERAPLFPLSIFSSCQFTGANLVTFVVYGALGAALFLLPIQLEQVGHYSPLEAGAATLPVTFIMFLLSARSGALSQRIGPRLQMSVGPVVVALGVVLFERIGVRAGYVSEVLPAVLVFGFGLAITVAPLTATVLAAAPTEQAGVASAINNDVARTASLIAVAVLPAAAGIGGVSYLHPLVFAAGFHTAVAIAAAACVLGGGIAAATIRNPTVRAGASRHDLSCPLDAPPLRLGAPNDGRPETPPG